MPQKGCVFLLVFCPSKTRIIWLFISIAFYQCIDNLVSQNQVEAPNKSKRSGLEPKWQDWASAAKKVPDEKPLENIPKPPRTVKETAKVRTVKCSQCNGTGFKWSGLTTRRFYPQCPACRGTGKEEEESLTTWVRRFDFVSVLKFLLLACVAFWFLSALLSPPKEPDYLGSAEEKMDKGVPLNAPEQDAVKNALGLQSDDEKAKEIEQKHGE